jgi:hypothetical protein
VNDTVVSWLVPAGSLASVVQVLSSVEPWMV